MPDLMTIAFMIALSSVTAAGMVAFVGRTHRHEGAPQTAATLVCYGMTYLSISLMASAGHVRWFLAAYGFFACGQSCWIWALHRFHQLRPPYALLVVLPIVSVLGLSLDSISASLRVQLISSLFLGYEVWALYLLTLRRAEAMNRGTMVLIVGTLMFAAALLLRLHTPVVSLTLRDTAASTPPLLLSFVILSIAMHFKSTGFLMMCHERKQVLLDRMANVDVLTELPNRRALMHSLEHVWQQCQRCHTPLSVLMVDVDHFKRVNDACGHPEGDKVLAQISRVLQSHVRPSDIVGRNGGEEFVIACPHTASAEAQVLAERLCAQVRSAVSAHHDTSAWPITISVGLHVCLPGDGQTLEDSVLQADQALYHAKADGRNRVHLLTPSPGTRFGT